MAPSEQRSRLTYFLDAGIILCIGLFPVLYLKSLQLVAVLLLIGVFSQGRSVFKALPALHWHHIAILQFVLFFFANALFFERLPETPLHQRPVALEAWMTTTISLGLLWLYLRDARSFEAVWRLYLPIGLLASFVVMTYEFMFIWDGSGNRVRAFAPNAQVPPMWYLVLTLISFTKFQTLNRIEKTLRFVILGLAAIMIMYAGARLALIAWCLSVLVMGVYLIRLQPVAQRRALTLYASSGLTIFFIGIYILDRATAGILDERIRETLHGLSNESTTFFRLELWKAAGIVISEALPWGVGQINERPLVTAALNQDFILANQIDLRYTLRAHQTYLSYLIAGGYIALISGLLFQAAAARLLQARQGSGLFPAAFGLICIPALNCLTDSVFQSYVAVQFYILLTLVLSNEVKQRQSE